MDTIINKRFGKLIVIKEAEGKFIRKHYVCKCDCGNISIVQDCNLKQGRTKSCGCSKKEFCSKASQKHGYVDTRLHNCWMRMRARCHNKNGKRYKDYGGRGITVCDEWQEFLPFYNWSMANGYKDNLTIDRIDVNGNYEPSNCRWVTMEEQQKNKRNTIKYTYKGEEYTTSEIAKKLGLSNDAVYCKFYKPNEEDIISNNLTSRKVNVDNMIKGYKINKKDIKRIRLANNLTRIKFAEVIGVSDDAVSLWEKGKNSISSKNIKKIINYCILNNIEIKENDNETDSDR